MRDSTITNRLMSAKQFTLIFAKTNKFKKIVHSLQICALSATCMTFLDLYAFMFAIVSIFYYI